eukprot:gene12010-10366_t
MEAPGGEGRAYARFAHGKGPEWWAVANANPPWTLALKVGRPTPTPGALQAALGPPVSRQSAPRATIPRPHQRAVAGDLVLPGPLDGLVVRVRLSGVQEAIHSGQGWHALPAASYGLDA